MYKMHIINNIIKLGEERTFRRTAGANKPLCSWIVSLQLVTCNIKLEYSDIYKIAFNFYFIISFIISSNWTISLFLTLKIQIFTLNIKLSLINLTYLNNIGVCGIGCYDANVALDVFLSIVMIDVNSYE